MFFLNNTGVFLYAFAAFYFSGLGISLILLPQPHKKYVFLLAPLIGISLLTLLGLFQIVILLVPYTPRANISVLLIVSLLICLVFCRRDIRSAWAKFKASAWLFIIPTLLIFVFSWMFHQEGLHLLVGSSDQLQYCENARQILEEMHTGSSLDVPVPRKEYYIAEAIKRQLPYLKVYRRGAELMLATTASITGLSYQASYSVMVLNALLTLGLIMGFIGQLFMKLSKFYTVILQLAFTSCFYFYLLNIQGSLALLLSIPVGLATLAFLSSISSQSTWRNLALTAIITAAYFSIYPEPALINVLFPSFVLLLWHAFKNKSSFYLILRNIAYLYLLVFMLAPTAFHNVFATAAANFKLLVPLNSTMTGASYTSLFQSFAYDFSMQAWELTGAVLGLISYYDTGSFHNTMRDLFINHPIVGFMVFILMSICGLLGCVKTNNLFARLLCIPTVSWIAVAFVTAYKHDGLRFARSLHYLMPFTLVGMVLLASRYELWSKNILSIKRRGLLPIFTRSQIRAVILQLRQQTLSKVFVSIILISFIFINIYTTFRTVRFVAKHNNRNDPVLLHFDERDLEWRLLKKDLRYSASHHVPVLISGFKETVRPFAISIIIRDQMHILGKKLARFWNLYDPSEPLLNNTLLSKDCKNIYETIQKFGIAQLNAMPDIFQPYKQIVFKSLDFYRYILTFKLSNEYQEWSMYNTRLQSSKMLHFQHYDNRPWYGVEAELISKSEQAVIPFDVDYPEEWLNNKDIFPPLIKNFPNVGKVIYRHQYVVTLPNRILAPLERDTKGAYRKLLASGSIIFHKKTTVPHIFTLNYDGKVGDIKLQVGDKCYTGEKNSLDGEQVTIVTMVNPRENLSLDLQAKGTVRLRSIYWTSAAG